jgi:hypothetical protein
VEVFLGSLSKSYKKDSVRTSQETLRVLYRARPVNAAYCENHTEHTDALCGRNVEVCDYWVPIPSPLTSPETNSVLFPSPLTSLETNSVPFPSPLTTRRDYGGSILREFI